MCLLRACRLVWSIDFRFEGIVVVVFNGVVYRLSGLLGSLWVGIV